MAIIQREDFLMRVFDVLAWILIINGLHELSVFLRRRFRGDLINIIGNIGVGIFILSYTAIPIRLLFAIFAIYITLNGIIKFISYLNYKKDKVSKRLSTSMVDNTNSSLAYAETLKRSILHFFKNSCR